MQPKPFRRPKKLNFSIRQMDSLLKRIIRFDRQQQKYFRLAKSATNPVARLKALKKAIEFAIQLGEANIAINETFRGDLSNGLLQPLSRKNPKRDLDKKAQFRGAFGESGLHIGDSSKRIAALKEQLRIVRLKLRQLGFE